MGYFRYHGRPALCSRWAYTPFERFSTAAMWALPSLVGAEWTVVTINMAQTMNTYRNDMKKTFFGIVLLV
ncbi:MAG: hypothetical protein A2X81_06945 [Desulfobacterales bacterium GWB2_56_26]|nr:MAG: hypothetical protein A2X81_06945 [Desulfobacterales bacterium GWB2_56_26]